MRKLYNYLSFIGAINWGLIGILNFNLVEFLLGNGILARIVYSLIGICGLLSFAMLLTHDVTPELVEE